MYLLKLLVVTVVFPFSALSAELCESGFLSYKNTLYQVQRNRCANCHGDFGTAISHSSSDAKLAYEITLSLVSFRSFDQSLLAEKVKSKHWLQEPNYQFGDGAEVFEVEDAISDWWTKGQSSCPSTNDFVSHDVELPVDLPNKSSQSFVVISWDLGKTNPKWEGVVFNLEVQRFSDRSGELPGSYRVRNPTLIAKSLGLSVKGLRVLVNGDSRPYENIYDEVEASLVPGTSLVLSKQQMVLIQRTERDKLSIAFRVFAHK